MKYSFLIMAQYNSQAVIPVEKACNDYMKLTVEKLKLKCSTGEIDMPLTRLEPTVKKRH